jgi:hypothetical protein
MRFAPMVPWWNLVPKTLIAELRSLSIPVAWRRL